MASQLLVNVLSVGPLGAGASTTVAHELKSGDVGVVPTQVICDRASPIQVTTTTTSTITFTNTDASNPASANFRAEYDHSIHAVGATPLNWQGYVAPAPVLPAAVFGSYSLNAALTALPEPPAAPLAIPYDVTEDENGVTLVSGSQITVSQDGVYEIDISPELQHTGTASTITMWLRLNGTTPVTRSCSAALLSSSIDPLFFYVPIILRLNAGDYLEWMIQSSGPGVSNLISYPASGVGVNAQPETPAVIATIKLLGS
jgi:hypothetical protein